MLPSRFVPFKSMVDRFQVHPAPRRPIAKEEIWLAGRRVEGRGEESDCADLTIRLPPVLKTASTVLTPIRSGDHQTDTNTSSTPGVPSSTRSADPHQTPSFTTSKQQRAGSKLGTRFPIPTR